MNQADTKIITKIEQQSLNKDRYSLYINDAYKIGVSSHILAKYRLVQGQEISNIEDVIKSDENKIAENYALKLLSYANKSEQEIILKMREKEFEPESIERTIDFLKKYSYINDEAYASSLVENRDRKSVVLGNSVYNGGGRLI